MSQSLSTVYIHATFGTKNRQRNINGKIAPHLHSYMASIFQNLDSPALIINSMPDHVHILFRLSKNLSVATIIEEVKKNSSKWMKSQKMGTPSFYWQKGYGAFSVSGSHVNVISSYIANQKEHHKKLKYRDEVQRLMEKYNVKEYNQDYLLGLIMKAIIEGI